MVDYIRNIFFLGNRPIGDLIEGTTNPEAVGEDLNSLLAVFSLSTGLSVIPVTFRDLSGPNTNVPNGVIEEDFTHTDIGVFVDGTTDDRVLYDIGAGEVTAVVDNIQQVNVRLLLGDGTVVEIEPLVLTQMTNGDVFLSEIPGSSTLDNYTLQSIFVHAIDDAIYPGLEIPPDIVGTRVVCFEASTLVDTPGGPVAVADLTAGDRVCTLDHGAQQVKWVGQRVLDHAHLQRFPNHRPIRIRKGALGDGLPLRDLMLSPQHRVMLCSQLAQLHFGEAEVLVAAKHLIRLKGVERVDTLDAVTYVHILCESHEVVSSEGIPSETLLMGEETSKTVDLGAHLETRAFFGARGPEGGPKAPSRQPRAEADETVQARAAARGVRAKRVLDRALEKAMQGRQAQRRPSENGTSLERAQRLWSRDPARLVLCAHEAHTLVASHIESGSPLTLDIQKTRRFQAGLSAADTQSDVRQVRRAAAG